MSSLGSVALGNQAPSVELLPSDSVGSAGAEAVELAALAGLELDPWQQYVLKHALSEQDDGMWSAFMVAVVVSRQNGKGAILEARELAGLFLLDERLILHSAHEFKTCYEHFLRIVGLIENTPDLDKRVQKIRRGVGEQAIELKNGNRLRFIARSTGSGRGMSAPCVVLDEAMFLTDAQVGAVVPVLSAQTNPQLWFTSSAPLSTSLPLHRLREQARSGDADRLFYAEWGNEPNVDPADEDAIARANPALGRRLFFDFIEAERAAMSPAEFGRERLGIPEPPPSLDGGAVDLAQWESLGQVSLIESHRAWALSVTPDRQWAALGVAGRRADGRPHVEWMEHRSGTGWVVERVVEGWAARKIPIRIHATGAEGSFIAPLRERGVGVEEITTGDVAKATGQFIDAVNDGTLVHLGQSSLTKAVRLARLRTSTGGGSVWDESGGDVSTLKAVTVALGGVPQVETKVADAWVLVD